MKNAHHHLFMLISLCILTLISNISYSACIRHNKVTFSENSVTPLNFGTIYYSDYINKKSGYLIRSTTVKASHSIVGDQPMWTCDKTDLGKIYFLVATSGANTYGGHEDLGDGIYATWFRYLGLKQTMDGVTLGRTWKKVPLKKYKINGNKIEIRLSDIPPLKAELIKVDKLPASHKVRLECSLPTAIAGKYQESKAADGSTKRCMTASARIQLAGAVGDKLGHDKENQDSDQHGNFYMSSNGIAYGLGTSNTNVIHNYTCTVNTNNASIKIPKITANELNNGATSSTNFNVNVECTAIPKEHKRVPTPSRVKIGFLPSSESHNHAKKLNLLHNDVSQFLVANKYGQDGTAKGIGVAIQNPKIQKNINFLRPQAILGGDTAAGWYPLTTDSTKTTNAGVDIYNKEYRAVLQRLPGHTAEPGKFKASATIVVQVQ